MKDLKVAFRMFDRGEDGTLNAFDLGMMLRTLSNKLLDPGSRMKLSVGGVQLVNATGEEADKKRASVERLGIGMLNRINRRNSSRGDVSHEHFAEYVMALRTWVLTALFEQYDMEDKDMPAGQVSPRSFGEVMIIRFAPEAGKQELRERLTAEGKELAEIHLHHCIQFGIFIRNVHNIERWLFVLCTACAVHATVLFPSNRMLLQVL